MCSSELAAGALQPCSVIFISTRTVRSLEGGKGPSLASAATAAPLLLSCLTMHHIYHMHNAPI